MTCSSTHAIKECKSMFCGREVDKQVWWRPKSNEYNENRNFRDGLELQIPSEDSAAML